MKKIKDKLKKFFKAVCSFCERMWKSTTDLQLYPCTKLTMFTYVLVYVLWKFAITHVSVSMREPHFFDVERHVSVPVSLTFMRRFFGFSLSHLSDGNIISLFGSIFSHLHLYSLLHNMLAIFAFGSFVEQHAGSFVFFIISITGMIGHLVQAVFDNKFIKFSGHTILGANASIFGLFGYASYCYLDKFLNQNLLPLLFYLLYIIRDYTAIRSTVYSNVGSLAALLAGYFIGVWSKNKNFKKKENSEESKVMHHSLS